MTPEHIDIGRQHFVVLSPIDCSADETTGSAITAPSARIWTFADAAWTCYDLDSSNGLTGGHDTNGNAWALDGTRRRLVDDWNDILARKQ